MFNNPRAASLLFKGLNLFFIIAAFDVEGTSIKPASLEPWWFITVEPEGPKAEWELAWYCLPFHRHWPNSPAEYPEKDIESIIPILPIIGSDSNLSTTEYPCRLADGFAKTFGLSSLWGFTNKPTCAFALAGNNCRIVLNRESSKYCISRIYEEKFGLPKCFLK